jgi:hypothetical protein
VGDNRHAIRANSRHTYNIANHCYWALFPLGIGSPNIPLFPSAEGWISKAELLKDGVVGRGKSTVFSDKKGL